MTHTAIGKRARCLYAPAAQIEIGRQSRDAAEPVGHHLPLGHVSTPNAEAGYCVRSIGEVTVPLLVGAIWATVRAPVVVVSGSAAAEPSKKDDVVNKLNEVAVEEASDAAAL